MWRPPYDIREAAPKNTADEEETLFPRPRSLDHPGLKALWRENSATGTPAESAGNRHECTAAGGHAGGVSALHGVNISRGTKENEADSQSVLRVELVGTEPYRLGDARKLREAEAQHGA